MHELVAELDRQHATGGERAHGGAQTMIGQDGGMDSGRELAEVGEAGLELSASLPQEIEQVVVAQPALDEDQSQHAAEQPLLSAFVKIAREPVRVATGVDEAEPERVSEGELGELAGRGGGQRR